MTTTPDNPFLRLSSSFDPSHYYGSQTWVEFALRSMISTPTISMELIGLPGMGKTFLLRYLADRDGPLKLNANVLQARFKDEVKIFPVFVEFRLLPRQFHPYVYLFKRFREEFKTSDVVNGNDEITALLDSRDPTTPGEATGILEEALLALSRQKVRTAFLFDDFHLAFGLLDQEETTRLRPWREAAVFIITTEKRLDKVNAEAAGSPFYQTLQVVPFGGVPDQEARRIIGDPAQEAGWSFAKQDIDFALTYTDGHPLLLITAGRAIWDARNILGYIKGSRAAVSKDYSSMLVGQFKEWFHPIFKMYLDHLDAEEQQALSNAATADQQAPDEDRALAFLAKLGIVTFDRSSKTGHYKPFSPLLTDYLKERTAKSIKVSLEGISAVEAELLQYLEAHQREPVSYEELAQQVWKEKPETPREKKLMHKKIQVAVSRLRKKLQDSKKGDIVSMREQGYILVWSDAAR